MSQSPQERKTDNLSTYLRRGEELSEMVSQGRSWSGEERNRVFLNPGPRVSGEAGRFTNISALSGFDFDDDARAIATLDWDHDGDIDLWVRNRNAPQLRLMRNEIGATTGDFLRLQLIGDGVTTNRNAVGARVEVTLSDGLPPLVRTLRAGEGFLSQSSKVLHFGLGSDPEMGVESIVVRWPDSNRSVATFREGVSKNRAYQIVQGEGLQLLNTPPRDTSAIEPLPQEPPADTGAIRTYSQSLFPWPGLSYFDRTGESQTASRKEDHWLLVNLWASWCPPCQAELQEFASHEAEFERAKINVLALSVDLPEGFSAESSSYKNAEHLLDEVNFPFPAGYLEAGQIEVLQTISDFLTSLNHELPVPTSFLISPDNQIVALYQGAISAANVIRDTTGKWDSLDERLKRLTGLEGSLLPHQAVRRAAIHREAEFQLNSAREIYDRSIPSAITFLTESLVLRPDHAETRFLLGNALNDTNEISLATDQYKKLLSEPKAHSYRSASAYQMSVIALKRGNLGDAMSWLEKTLELEPDHLVALNNLAYLLVTQTSPSRERDSRAVAMAEKAVARSNRQQLNFLDTLASVYAAVGRTEEAVEIIKEAIVKASREDDLQLLEKLRYKLNEYQGH